MKAFTKYKDKRKGTGNKNSLNTSIMFYLLITVDRNVTQVEVLEFYQQNASLYVKLI